MPIWDNKEWIIIPLEGIEGIWDAIRDVVEEEGSDLEASSFKETKQHMKIQNQKCDEVA